MPKDRSSAAQVSLIAELCRIFNAGDRYVTCVMSHGQLLVSGYTVKPEHDRRWTASQLAGRTAEIVFEGKSFRKAVLFPEIRSSIMVTHGEG